jgi:hypothetical protein
MNEADEQFAARLAEDLDTYVGPEITVQEVDLGDVDVAHAHLRAICDIPGGSEVLESDGETRLEAYNELVLRAAELRLVVAARGLDEEALIGLSLAWHASVSQEPR